MVGLVGLVAPRADAATTIGIEHGVGPNAGTAVRVTGDRQVNDITITLSGARFTGGGAGRFTLQVVDRRGRARADKEARYAGCRARSRSMVLCQSSVTALVYVVLGPGNDRLTVKSNGGVAPLAAPAAPAPDGLAGIPSDEDGQGGFLGWMIDGGAGDDRIVGSPLFDHIIGGPGSDVLDGRRGDDLFEQGAQAGSDTIRGGAGRDALRWRARTALNIDLGQGTFSGGSVESIEKVRSGDANDTLIGSDGPDMLQGAGGADVIAGRGGADLLVGDGAPAVVVAADTIDGGAGDDVLDVDNKAFDPYAGLMVGPAGPADRLSCGEGSDRVDASASQLVPADCEGSRFLDAAATVALRPTLWPDGSLVYDIPCPAQNYAQRPIGVCDGTLTLTNAATGAPLGSALFSDRGATHAFVVITPASPVAAGELVGVRITGVFDRAPPDGPYSQFDFGWATTDPYRQFDFGWATTF